MTVTAKIVTLDLNEFMNADRYQQQTGLWGRETGLKASKHFKVNSMTDPNTMIVLKMVKGARMDDSFLKALLGPLARKVGPDELAQRIKIDGGYWGGRVGYRDCLSTEQQVAEYLVEESQRIAVRQHKKNKETNAEWSDGVQFFVPDIGTRVRLTQDWTFRLYAESRNYDFFKKMDWKYRALNWRDDRPMDERDVTINAGSILKVNRIYIRQGVKAYSSITRRAEFGFGRSCRM
jgi:hypothetical protein